MNLSTDKNPFARKGKMPSKRTINLAMVGMERIQPKKVISILGVIFILAFLCGKFLVYDNMIALSKLQEETLALGEEKGMLLMQIHQYDDLVEEYAHYSYDGMSEEELALADRAKLMEILEKDVMSGAKIQSWILHGNEMEITFTDHTLGEINEIAQTLQKEDLIEYCTVSTAKTNEADMIQDDGKESNQVSATMMVYLKSANADDKGENGHENTK